MAINSRMLNAIALPVRQEAGIIHYVDTSMQIASVVDHPALIITRNIEWWARLLRVASAHFPISQHL